MRTLYLARLAVTLPRMGKTWSSQKLTGELARISNEGLSAKPSMRIAQYGVRGRISLTRLGPVSVRATKVLTNFTRRDLCRRELGLDKETFARQARIHQVHCHTAPSAKSSLLVDRVQ